MEDFDYIIKRLPPARICFGTSLPRSILPTKSGHMNSFMRRFTGEPSPDKAFDEFDDTEPTDTYPKTLGKFGYGPLVSRVPRFLPVPTGLARYSVGDRDKKPFIKCAAKAFGRSMHEYAYDSNTPGPGMFAFRKRKEIRRSTFGGPQSFTPAVITCCRPTFITTCFVCRKIPKGIYWRHKRLDRNMCRNCMVATKLQLTKDRSKVRQMRITEELNTYARTRYCDFIHMHHNTTAKIKVINDRELANQIRIENYLSAFNL